MQLTCQTSYCSCIDRSPYSFKRKVSVALPQQHFINWILHFCPFILFSQYFLKHGTELNHWLPLGLFTVLIALEMSGSNYSEKVHSRAWAWRVLNAFKLVNNIQLKVRKKANTNEKESTQRTKICNHIILWPWLHKEEADNVLNQRFPSSDKGDEPKKVQLYCLTVLFPTMWWLRQWKNLQLIIFNPGHQTCLSHSCGSFMSPTYLFWSCGLQRAFAFCY